MSDTKRIWVVDYDGPDVPSGGPEFDEDQVIVADTHFVLVQATWDEVERATHDLSYWKPRVPKAGRWIAASGAEVYLDENLQIVQSAEDVLASLGDYSEELAHTDADTILDDLGRVF